MRWKRAKASEFKSKWAGPRIRVPFRANSNDWPQTSGQKGGCWNGTAVRRNGLLLSGDHRMTQIRELQSNRHRLRHLTTSANRRQAMRNCALWTRMTLVTQMTQ